jgi:hypothetical protein
MDIYHDYGNDFELSPTGNLETVDGSLLTSQTVVRYILTNPGDDSFTPTFGLGAARYIGKPSAPAQTQALITGGLKTLDVVDQTQPTLVNVYFDDGTLTAQVSYTNAQSDEVVTQTLGLE